MIMEDVQLPPITTTTITGSESIMSTTAAHDDHHHLPLSSINIIIDHPKPNPNSNIISPSVDDHDQEEEEEDTTIFSILTGFHAGYFRISLSLCGQALLWKTLSDHTTAGDTHALLRPPSAAFVLLWCIALLSLVVLSFLYVLRFLFKFQHFKAEFRHHVGMNYLFAPWISWLLLLQSSPYLHHDATVYRVLWWIFSVPILALDVKIYGQWFANDGKKYHLSMVANPTSQMSVIGNLVGARAAARIGWGEAATCMFALGMAHYLVLFVTLYQRFVGGSKLPAMLRPVFFLFIAAPSMASLAWDSISGSFDIGSKMLFFLSLFLFASLASRAVMFKKSMSRFNVAWWAYCFPVTLLAMAAAEYAREVRGGLPNALMLLLSTLSLLLTAALLAFTAFNTAALLPSRHAADDDDPFAPSPTLPSQRPLAS